MFKTYKFQVKRTLSEDIEVVAFSKEEAIDAIEGRAVQHKVYTGVVDNQQLASNEVIRLVSVRDNNDYGLDERYE